jgi:hypothetical protein
MRLTLRTLLAWLDDTLPPPEVRNIGQQVAESEFAQKLVERIGKVTRRRRLTVPSGGGPEGTDPAVVAAYLDNELSSDEVAEFEKKCLESDVQLAEVASVHQILSLIGQKAKVPAEARLRMYRLIKGRESVNPRTSVSSSPPEPEPAAALLPPWQPPDIPPRSAWERFGPVAAVVGLIGLLSWSAWQIAGPTSGSTPDGTLALQSAASRGASSPDMTKVAADSTKSEEASKTAPNPAEAGTDAEVAPKKDTEPPNETTPPAEASKAASQMPPGAAGVSGNIDGIALRFNNDDATKPGRWDRLGSQKGLKANDRIIALGPFRAPLKLTTAPIELVGNTEVHLVGPAAGDPVRLELPQGRVVIRGGTPPEAVAVRLGDQVLRITPPPGGVVGVERLGYRGSADPRPSPAIRIFVPDGEVKFESDAGTEPVAGPASVLWQPAAKLAIKVADPSPAWVTETTPSGVAKTLGEDFLQYFKPDVSVLTGLNEALADGKVEIRHLALAGLEMIGSLDMIVPSLSSTDGNNRRIAISVLRDFAARSPEAATALADELKRQNGAEWAADVQKMLDGYSAKEAGEEATYIHLVKLLKNPDVGIRELALQSLEALTGRNNLDYDPDKPDGRGLQAWQDLLKRKELPPKAAKAATKDK